MVALRLPATPVTKPFTETTLATEGALLLHKPPGVALVRVIVLPIHKAEAPIIVDKGFTVTVVTEAQPFAKV
jgi:hypothetical protein